MTTRSWSNIPLFVVLAEDALARAGVTLHYHAAPVRIEALPTGWRVRTAATGDTRTITCKQLVDCTGNGTAAALAGFERLREKERQPGTFVYRIRPKRTSRNSTRRNCRRALRRRSRTDGSSATIAAGVCCTTCRAAATPPTTWRGRTIQRPTPAPRPTCAAAPPHCACSGSSKTSGTGKGPAGEPVA
jgi:hypothetical protein